jgi:hypothetical protein
MIRKTFIALAATVALGAAALVPTAASAKHFGGGIHRHGGWGHGWGYGGIYVVGPGYSDCVQWVRVGYRTWRKMYVCG